MEKPNPLSVHHRTIVVGLVWNSEGKLLFCKMAPDRGVFPGEWGFPGGGIEPGEKMVQALRRELREELGIEVENIRPAFFKDGTYSKLMKDGSQVETYMIFLLFHCNFSGDVLALNDEFTEHRWVAEREVGELTLNQETVDTLDRLGWKQTAWD
jgi:nucleoside triphosphatase